MSENQKLSHTELTVIKAYVAGKLKPVSEIITAAKIPPIVGPIKQLLEKSAVQVFNLLREDKITILQGKVYALAACEESPENVTKALEFPGLMSPTQMKKFAKLAIEENPGLVVDFYKKKLYSEEEAKKIAFRIIKQYPGWGRKYVQKNFLTQTEVNNVSKKSL